MGGDPKGDAGPPVYPPDVSGADLDLSSYDDSSWVRKSLGYYLNQCLGLEIVGSAADGTQAVEQVAILHPDLVLMDWRMPGVDGVEATRKIKSRPGAPVVVLMSLDNNLQFQTVAQDSGADLWVGKQELYSKFLPLLQQLFSMKFRGAEPFAGPSVD